MKQSYIRPTVVFHPVALSANTATGHCDRISNHDQMVCPVAVDDTGWTLFMDLSICNATPSESGDGGYSDDSVCYNVPNAEHIIHTS